MQMEPSNSNFSNKSGEIMGDDLERTSYLKAGINRLLYPQKYIYKGIVQVEEDNFILDDDKQDETVMSFCELVFFHFVARYIVDEMITIRVSDIIAVVNRRLCHVKNPKYATFHKVHKFFTCINRTSRGRILHYFQYNKKTIIEILELLDEDDKYGSQIQCAMQRAKEKSKNKKRSYKDDRTVHRSSRSSRFVGDDFPERGFRDEDEEGENEEYGFNWDEDDGEVDNEEFTDGFSWDEDDEEVDNEEFTDGFSWDEDDEEGENEEFTDEFNWDEDDEEDYDCKYDEYDEELYKELCDCKHDDYYYDYDGYDEFNFGALDTLYYSDNSHRRFEKLIKRENYPPLFFAVLVFNLISKTTKRLDFIKFVFTNGFKLDTLSMENAREHVIYSPHYIRGFVESNPLFSDCKFTEWVDEWLENFDSFINKDEFAKWIDYDSDDNESNEFVSDNNIESDISEFLSTRGWKIPGSSQINKYMGLYIGLKKNFKKYVEDELMRTAVRYSIIQDCITNEDRAKIYRCLSQTHYYTIFNKLVEYYTTKYLDKGQEQKPLQVAESSAAKKSNEVEQQNTPAIIIDKDEAHKKWFVRVHEKKINAQPDEWNKKLYTCLDALYESLVKNRLMCESSKKELFIYRFSGFNIPEPFNPLEKIKWEGENVLLGHLVRCLITYTGTGAKDLGTAGTFFIGKSGNEVNLATAKYISKERFNHTPNMFPNLKHAVEILKECGFDEVEVTSTRTRDK